MTPRLAGKRSVVGILGWATGEIGAEVVDVTREDEL